MLSLMHSSAEGEFHGSLRLAVPPLADAAKSGRASTGGIVSAPGTASMWEMARGNAMLLAAWITGAPMNMLRKKSAEPAARQEPPKETRSSILVSIDTRTKVLALISLIAEALFLGAAFALPKEHILYALVTCAVVLLTMTVGIIYVDAAETKRVPKSGPSEAFDKLLGQLDRIEQKSGSLETLDKVLTQLDRIEQIARHDAGNALLVNLLGLQKDIKVHCHAGGMTISSLFLEDLPRSANDFYQMFRGSQHELQLREHHMVARFLQNLITALPRGSVWLGITRLEDHAAWGDKGAIPYRNFQHAAERRVRNKELSYFRLWAFDKEDHVKLAEEIMRQQQTAGFQTRFVVANQGQVDDISLIWTPTTNQHDDVAIRDPDDPVDELAARADTFEPLCGIKFEARGGRELDAMVIYTRTGHPTDDFERLCGQFQERWKDASDLPDFAAEKKRESPRVKARRNGTTGS